MKIQIISSGKGSRQFLGLDLFMVFLLTQCGDKYNAKFIFKNCLSKWISIKLFWRWGSIQKPQCHLIDAGADVLSLLRENQSFNNGIYNLTNEKY